LTGAAGFFTWAQPAIPARAAPAINQCNKNFFTPKKSEHRRSTGNAYSFKRDT
jgi:hypothetical protein